MDDADVEEENLFPFHENDLTYRHYKPTQKECASAVIFFVMDISGSMTKTKKFIARSFYFLLYHFIRSKYEHTEIVFVSHDTAAQEVCEEQFFSRGNVIFGLVTLGQSNLGKYMVFLLSGESVNDIVYPERP